MPSPFYDIFLIDGEIQRILKVFSIMSCGREKWRGEGGGGVEEEEERKK